VDRRQFLAGMSLALVAGCAQVRPGASPTTSSAAPALAVGSDGTPVGEVMAALLVAALTAGGVPATRVEAPPAVDQLVPAVAAGDVQVQPAYAASLLAAVSGGVEPPHPDEVVTDLASLLAPEVVVLRPVGVDGHLVYATAGASGLDSLAELRDRVEDAVLAAPSWLAAAPDGTAGLAAVYSADFRRVVDVADVSERIARVRSGAALVGAFRASELTPDSGLTILADPELLVVADPQVVLVTPQVAASEAAVLAIDGLQEAVTTDDLASLAGLVAAGERAGDVAGAWWATRR